MFRMALTFYFWCEQKQNTIQVCFPKKGCSLFFITTCNTNTQNPTFCPTYVIHVMIKLLPPTFNPCDFSSSYPMTCHRSSAIKRHIKTLALWLIFSFKHFKIIYLIIIFKIPFCHRHVWGFWFSEATSNLQSVWRATGWSSWIVPPRQQHPVSNTKAQRELMVCLFHHFLRFLGHPSLTPSHIIHWFHLKCVWAIVKGEGINLG